MIEQALYSISQFYPEIVIILTLCVIIMADLITKSDKPVTGWIMLGGLVISGITILFQVGQNGSFFYNMVVVDPFAVFFKLLLVLAGIFVVLFSLQ
ncbi:MAG: hypothetical protein GVY07_06695, partial [Bacteroidetes bacterium]|nr:hypothetical protein [Bacteroidota bacterium]